MIEFNIAPNTQIGKIIIQHMVWNDENKYNLNYMLDTEHCSDNERQEKLAMVQYTFEQVLSIQAEQVNGKSEEVETSSAFKKVLPESNMLDDIIPINKNLKIC